MEDALPQGRRSPRAGVRRRGPGHHPGVGCAVQGTGEPGSAFQPPAEKSGNYCGGRLPVFVSMDLQLCRVILKSVGPSCYGETGS